MRLIAIILATVFLASCSDDVNDPSTAAPGHLSVRTDSVEIDVEGTTTVLIELANLSPDAPIDVLDVRAPFGISVGEVVRLELAPGQSAEFAVDLTVDPLDLVAGLETSAAVLTLVTSADEREIPIVPYFDVHSLHVVGATGDDPTYPEIEIPPTAPGTTTAYELELVNPTGRTLVLKRIILTGGTQLRLTGEALELPLVLDDESVVLTIAYSPTAPGYAQSVLVLVDAWSERYINVVGTSP